jgi:hypothetical protein
MTAFDLLQDGNDTFRTVCGRWYRDGRAYLPYADWFRSLGLDGQADAWEWAATEPDRDSGGGDVGGVRPVVSEYRFVWSPVWLTQPRPYRSDLPRDLCWGPFDFHAFPAAIAWFLDRWDAVYGGRMPVVGNPGDPARKEDWDDYLTWSQPYTKWGDPYRWPPPPLPGGAPTFESQFADRQRARNQRPGPHTPLDADDWPECHSG